MNGQTLVKAFIPLPGGGTAIYGPSGLMYYRHSDWLGSSRLASTPTRALYYDGAYAPFGESYAETGTSDRSFTGQNSDTVSGLADFLFREYSGSQQGRWISPDPAGMAAVSLTNPQSWNRYAYVGNDPLAVVDPLGLIGPCGPEIACPITTPAGCNWGAVNNSLELFCPDNFENDNFIIWQGTDGTDGGGTIPCLAGAGPLLPGQVFCPCNFQGTAKSPSQYAAAGTEFKEDYIDPVNGDNGAGLIVGGLSYLYSGFQRGRPLDAQTGATGTSLQKATYGNYAYGVFFAAAGFSLNEALTAASIYGYREQLRGAYPGRTFDPNYSGIPVENVQDITAGYLDQIKGTTCH